MARGTPKGLLLIVPLCTLPPPPPLRTGLAARPLCPPLPSSSFLPSPPPASESVVNVTVRGAVALSWFAVPAPYSAACL